jgi:hypothetical protein
MFNEIITALYALSLILALGLVWYFRADIKAGFRRVTKIGPIELAAEQTPSRPTEPVRVTATTPVVGAPEVGALQSGASGGLQQVIATIAALVSKDQLDQVMQATRDGLLAANKITEPKDLSEALLHYSAALAITLSHERNYRGIFGSQIQLLRQMETVADIDRSSASAIYEAARAANPEPYRYFTFDHWLLFLQQAGLVANAPNGNYVLTAFGRGFLRYILSQQLPLAKAL